MSYKNKTIFDFLETESKSDLIDDDSNILNKVIDRLCQLGTAYHSDGAGNFADNNGTEFEKEMEKSLDFFGFEKVEDINDLNINTTELKNIFKNPTKQKLYDNLESKFIDVYGSKNIYIPQPAGNNHEPDFAVYYNKRVYWFECKKMESSNKPKYGDNGCHPKIIYFMKRTKTKSGCQHTYYLGSDLITPEEYEAGLEEVKKLKKAIKLLSEDYPRCQQGTPRIGCNSNVDTVLGNSNQFQFELNVRNYISRR